MTYVSTCIADGAVGLWTLGDASGSTAVDATGNSDGTYVNGGTGVLLGQVGIPGGGNTAAKFVRASSGMVTIPSVAANQTADTFTVECWVKRASSGGAKQNMLCGNFATGPILYFVDATNVVHFGYVGGDIGDSGATTVTADGNWHHIAYTKNGAANHLYIDSVDVTANVSNATLNTNTGGWQFGRSTNDVSTYLDGTLAMGAVYGVALASAQVSNHYALGSVVSSPAGTIPGPPPLLGRGGR